MKVSVNWIKEHVNFELPQLDELTKKIGAQLGAVEAVENLADKYKGIVIAKIVSCQDHPNADRLHVCLIDDAGVAQGVERDANGYVQVVCGAPNAREGILVAWLSPGTTVPESYGEEPFVLTARDFRGQMSNGMLASARELALGTDHTGIVEIDANDAKPGDDFAKVFKLDDTIIDIENKMFTHRPDLFGELGVAREIAGILGQPFTSPEWYMTPRQNVLQRGADLPLTVQNELPELVPRFIAVNMHIDHIAPSPLWLRSALSRVGLRAINNVVDITNYLMILTGQPLHAYDYDKVKALSAGDAAVLAVRFPRPGEKLLLLNGKTVEPREQAIMIATDKQAIGLGGVMGGGDTEVDDNTKNIILECATFDMYSIRRTSMAHGLFTDAVTRFNKGQSPLQNDRVIAESMRLMGELAKATQASDVIDVKNESLLVKPTVVTSPNGEPVNIFQWGHVVGPITVSARFINERLGTKLSAEEMCVLLRNVEFSAHTDNHENPDEIEVIPPFWRTDVELPEDIVEEVGRLYGYDKLPLDLPLRSIEPTKKDPLLTLKSQVRENLVKGGANEVLTYSFVHGNLLDKVAQDKTQAFQLSNAISPDLQYYRVSLMPSLLDKVHANIKAGYSEFALFEIGKAHVLHEPDPFDPAVPKEVNALSLVYANNAPQQGAAYYVARKYLFALLTDFGVPLPLIKLEPLAGADLYHNPWIEQMVAPFEPNRSAVLRDGYGLIWGVVGEFKPLVRKNLKLPEYSAGFEIDPLLLDQPASNAITYVPLPRFPKVEQDICLKVPVAKTYREVYDFVWQQLQELKPTQTQATLGPVDIYQREDDKEHKQITLRLAIASYERTLTDDEVAKLLDTVAARAKETIGAERI